MQQGNRSICFLSSLLLTLIFLSALLDLMPGTTAEEFQLNIFPSSEQAAYFEDSGIKNPRTRECPVEALAAFHYMLNAEGKEIFGQVCGRNIDEGEDVEPENCSTPGRTDNCCITVDRDTGQGETQGSGVIYRDSFPPYFPGTCSPTRSGTTLAYVISGTTAFRTSCFRRLEAARYSLRGCFSTICIRNLNLLSTTLKMFGDSSSTRCATAYSAICS